MRINLVTPFAEKDAVKALGLAGMLPKSAGTSSMLLIWHRSRGGFRIWRPQWMRRAVRRKSQSQRLRRQYRPKHRHRYPIAWRIADAMYCLGM